MSSKAEVLKEYKRLKKVFPCASVSLEAHLDNFNIGFREWYSAYCSIGVGYSSYGTPFFTPAEAVDYIIKEAENAANLSSEQTSD